MATTAYTTEQTKELLKAYKSGATPQQLAPMVGRTVKSVIAKLSKEKVYEGPQKPASAPKLTKAALIAEIAVALNSSEEVLESLEKANHGVLGLIHKGLAKPGTV